MVVRKSKKVRKQRGTRTYGRGCSKRGRGSGEKGGKGMSGGHKQKWSYILRYMPDYFGKHGFVRPRAVRKGVNAINVGELDERVDELLRQGMAKREHGRIIIDASELGINKVLGGGRVTHPLEIAKANITESAKQKIEKAGGKVGGQ